jgi:DNA-binding NarL/FixJ family response regulator
MTTRVVVADDHTLVRQSIIKALSAEPGVEVVSEASDGPGLLAAVATHEPDLVVLDIAMPGVDGIAAGRRLRQEHPDLKLLYLSMHDDDNSLQQVVGLGAQGFVSKSASIEELLGALRVVRDGGSYLSPSDAQRVMALAAGRRPAGIALTARERDILELLASGHRPADIAATLFLAVKTVKNHLTSIYQKLGVETGTQAVAEAYRLGLVRPST